MRASTRRQAVRRCAHISTLVGLAWLAGQISVSTFAFDGTASTAIAGAIAVTMLAPLLVARLAETILVDRSHRAGRSIGKRMVDGALAYILVVIGGWLLLQVVRWPTLANAGLFLALGSSWWLFRAWAPFMGRTGLEPLIDLSPALANELTEIARRSGVSDMSMYAKDPGEPPLWRGAMLCRDRWRRVLVIEKGLITTNPEVVKAVSAHEFGHAAAAHGRVAAILSLSELFALWGSAEAVFGLHRSLSGLGVGPEPDSYAFPVLGLTAMMVLAITHSLDMAYSRHAEREADRGGAALVGQDQMIHALEVLAPETDAGERRRSRRVMSHPTVAQRIDALKHFETTAPPLAT